MVAFMNGTTKQVYFLPGEYYLQCHLFLEPIRLGPGTSRIFLYFPSAVPDSQPCGPSSYARVAWSENRQPHLEEAGIH